MSFRLNCEAMGLPELAPDPCCSGVHTSAPSMLSTKAVQNRDILTSGISSSERGLSNKKELVLYVKGSCLIANTIAESLCLLSTKQKFRNPQIQESSNPNLQCQDMFSPHAFHLEKKVEVFAAEVLRNHEVNCNHLNQLRNTQKPKKGAPNLSVSLNKHLTQRPPNPEIKKSRNPGMQNSSPKTVSAHMPSILRKKLKFLLQRGCKITTPTAIT